MHGCGLEKFPGYSAYSHGYSEYSHWGPLGTFPGYLAYSHGVLGVLTGVPRVLTPARASGLPQETCGTLKFATFSKSVVNRVTINVVADANTM